MDQWTGRDGLISNNLTSVNQSSSKFLWVTAFNGILRFDGVNFKLFDKNTLPFLNSNAFYQSFEDSKGNLWFASQSSGIMKYSDNKCQQMLTTNQSSLSVRCITEDNDGKLWVGTNNEGVYVLNDTILEKVDIDVFELTNIMDIQMDGDGVLWFATNGKGIFTYDGEKVNSITVEDGLNHNTVNKLILGPDNTMYAGTLDGLFYHNKNGSGRVDKLDGLEINDIIIDDYETFWIGTEQGLFKINFNYDIFENFTEVDGLPASQVSSLCFDHENSLWLSTKKAGLLRLRSGFFKNITTKDGLSSNNVNIIIQHEDKFYVGCDDGLINVVGGEKISRLKLKSSFHNIGIRDISFGENGQVLFASYKGLLVVQNGKEKLIDFTKYGSSNDIRRILRGKDGTIWLATRSGGVIKCTDFDNIKVFDSPNFLKVNYILAIEEGKRGEIYVGTHSGGMSIIDKDDQIKHYPIEEGKSGILIFNIHIMENGRIFIATNIGIYSFDNEVFTKITLDKNLKAETVFDIVVEDGNAWLSSNIGLIKIEVDEIDNFLSGKIKQVSGRLFDRFDGMASQECTGATKMTLSTDGKLWIPTLGGVAVLDPENIEENKSIPQVYITDFTTDHIARNLTNEKNIVIEPGILRYEFDFTSLSYVAPPKVRFKYKLSGVDNDWIDSESKREAIYTNLPNGKYTFSVIATNNDGIWNEKGASLVFIVKPYFYQTIFFYILIVISIGLIVWAIIFWRLHNIERVNQELRKLNEELDRFVYSASHDLRAPLASVLGLVEIARLETTVSGKDECLGMINSSIKKLDGFITDIIDFSRNQRVEIQIDKIDIEQEVKEVLNDLKYLDKFEKINISVVSHENRHFMTDGLRLRVILKNLVANAIRYHDLQKEDPFIKIEIKYSPEAATINVSDNGIGIDSEHLKNIFKMFYRADETSNGSGLGLYIVKESIEKLQGKIEVHSKLKEGTTFTIIIPSSKEIV